MDKFADFMPVFPANAGVSDAKRVAFIRQLVANDQAPVEIVPAQTGFIDKNTFATHAEILRADGSRTRIKQVEPGLGNPSAFKGSRQGTTNDVLRLATRSTYLAFGIGVELAASLPTYLKLRAGQNGALRVQLLTETAVFNRARSRLGKPLR
ncbi:MAG: hypothetical protein WBW73_12620 [Rhodoplanes sp.]